MNGAVGGMMVMDGMPHGLHPQLAQASHHHPHMPPPITSSMNRSQRCGVCRGCQCKPCGQCTYCQDSPQFGGPGVKKQSCIERRCLRVLENRLQRDAPTFKARVGCNNCEDCRMADCQICLVCLDKRFFDNRYMTGAMCAKKRCNNATSIELPAAVPPSVHEFAHRQIQAQKRCFEGPPGMPFEIKRPAMMYSQHMGIPPQMMAPQRHILMSGPPPPQFDMNNAMRVPPPNVQMPPMTIAPPTSASNLLQACPQIGQIEPMKFNNNTVQSQSPMSTPSPPSPPMPSSTPKSEQCGHSNGQTSSSNSESSPGASSVEPQATQQQAMSPFPPMQAMPIENYNGFPGFNNGLQDFCVKYYNDEIPHSDLFLPPSYSADTKNAVVLQPL